MSKEEFSDEYSEGDSTIDVIEKPVSIEEVIEQVGVGYTQYVLLIVTGLSFMSDAAEVTFLSFVTEQLKCEWGLTGAQETRIAQAVFIGMILGSPVWGCIADHIGRRYAFLWSSATICFFGFCTAFCNSYYQLVMARAIVGFGVAGLPIGFDILAEALPDAARGGFLLYIEYFWTVGSIYVNFCAFSALETAGWQVFTALAAIPTLLSTIAGYFLLPESPRWLADQHRNEEALEIVNKWAADNGSRKRYKDLVEVEPHAGGHGPMDLVRNPQLRKNSIFMGIGWFAFGVAYYGVVCLLPRILREQDKEEIQLLGNLTDCTGVDDPNPNCSHLVDVMQDIDPGDLAATVGDVTVPGAQPLDTEHPATTLSDAAEEVVAKSSHKHHKCNIKFDFKDIGISSLAEVLGVLFASFLIDKPGRVMTQCIFFSTGALCSIVLGFPEKVSLGVLTLASSGARLSEMAGSCSMWVHTPELFPTHLRAEIHGMLNLASKVGATFAQYLISDSVAQWVCGLTIAAISLSAAIAVLFLPETAGKVMGKDEKAGSEESHSENEDSEE